MAEKYCDSFLSITVPVYMLNGSACSSSTGFLDQLHGNAPATTHRIGNRDIDSTALHKDQRGDVSRGFSGFGGES
jgi:hypothetical protein